MSNLHLTLPARGLRPLSLALMLALVPACHHGSSGTSGGGPGGSTPLAISNLTVAPGPNFALITWETNRDADSRVEYGLSPAYTDSVSSAAQTTTHSLLLTGLSPATTYHFRALSEALDGGNAATDDDTFRTASDYSLLGDDFNRFNLNRSVWTYEDSLQRGELQMMGAGTDLARVVLRIAENQDYRPGVAKHRLVQDLGPSVAEGFEAKFLNPWTVTGGEGGVFLEAAPGLFAQFGFVYDGQDLLCQASRYMGNNLDTTASTFVQAGPWTNGEPLYLRVVPNGSEYRAQYSFDGINFLNGPVLTFAESMVQGGLYVANSLASDGATVLSTDYLFEIPDQFPVEDVGVPADHDDPYLYRYDVMALSDAVARVRWWSDEATTGTLRYGLTPDLLGGVEFLGEAGWVNELLVTNLDPGSLYQLELTAPDGRGQETILSGLTVQTPAPGGGNPTIRTWNGWDHPDLHLNVQVFGTHGNPQDTVNIVGRVFDLDESRVDLSNVLTWTLNDGPAHTALLGDPRSISGPGQAPWRLQDEGDYNIVLPVEDLDVGRLKDGYHRNELRLVSEDDDGNLGVQTVYVNWKPGTSWPANYMTDFESSALSQKEGPQYQVQVIDGAWYIDSIPGLGFSLRTNSKRLGYDRMFALGEALNNPWDDYVATIPFQVNGLDMQGFTPGTGSYAIGVINRWNGHQAGGPFEVPKHGIYPLSSLWTYRWFGGGNESWQVWLNQNQSIEDLAGPSITLGDVYTMKVRVQTQGDGSTVHSFKVWNQNDVEPASYQFTRTTPAGSGPDTGSLAIFAHHVDLVVGDISVQGL